MLRQASLCTQLWSELRVISQSGGNKIRVKFKGSETDMVSNMPPFTLHNMKVNSLEETDNFWMEMKGERMERLKPNVCCVCCWQKMKISSLWSMPNWGTDKSRLLNTQAPFYSVFQSMKFILQFSLCSVYHKATSAVFFLKTVEHSSKIRPPFCSIL